MKKYVFFLMVTLFAGVYGGVSDGTAQQTAKEIQGQNITRKTEDMTSGQVRKIDKETGRLTLKHEKIVNLNMPPMTMVFRVKDKSMLNSLRVGDTILFKATENNSVLTITEIK